MLLPHSNIEWHLLLPMGFTQILEKVQTAKRLFQGVPEEELRPRQEAWKEQRVCRQLYKTIVSEFPEPIKMKFQVLYRSERGVSRQAQYSQCQANNGFNKRSNVNILVMAWCNLLCSLPLVQLAELADAFMLFLRQHPDVSRFHSDLAKSDRLQPGGITDSQLQPLLEKLKNDVRYVQIMLHLAIISLGMAVVHNSKVL